MKRKRDLFGAVILIASLAASLTCTAKSLDLTGYQNREGAITVGFQDDFVDPYFAIKALLTAHNAGLDIRQPAMAWIAWLLPRQESDGLFKRFCRRDGGAWQACADADADDALLAMWMELLHLMAADKGLPPKWASSARLASQQLQRLLDKKTGIFLVSLKDPIGLFMDNVEIYAALRSVGVDQRRLGMTAAAQATLSQSAQLRHRIEQVFRPSGNGEFRVSTQPPEPRRFYPEEVAQIYPWLHHMPIRGAEPQSGFRSWLKSYGRDWLSQKKDQYPWGLVALTAQQLGDAVTASCWVRFATPLRHGERWNVLEEATYQSIRTDPSKIMQCQNGQKQ